MTIIADIYAGDAGVNLRRYRASGRRLIILKATEGVGYTDPAYVNRVREAHSLGLVVFHYLFARLDLHPHAGPEMRDFASAVRRHLGPRDGVILDWETGRNLPSSTIAAYLAGNAHLCRHLLGRELIGYANPDYLRAHPAWVARAIRRWWIAAYGPRPSKPAGVRTFWAWQFTDGIYGPPPHSVPGVHNGDLSRMPWARYVWLTRGPRRAKRARA